MVFISLTFYQSESSHEQGGDSWLNSIGFASDEVYHDVITMGLRPNQNWSICGCHLGESSWRSPACMTSSLLKGCFFAPRRCVLIVACALIVNALLFICRAEPNNQSLSGRVYLMIIHGFCFHSNICICYAVKWLITLQWQRREPLTQRSSIKPNKGSALLVTKIDFLQLCREARMRGMFIFLCYILVDAQQIPYSHCLTYFDQKYCNLIEKCVLFFKIVHVKKKNIPTSLSGYS